MEKFGKAGIRIKKLKRPTTRPFNSAVFYLRAKQLGLSFDEMDALDVGDIYDLITEQNNDSFQYPYEATEADFKNFFGG